VNVLRRAAQLARQAKAADALGRATARDLTPPDPSAYGAYGTNTWVVPPARVTSPERIFLGNDVTILEHTFLSVVAAVPGVTPTFRMGDRSLISRFVHVACVGEIDIGADVMVADRVFIGDTYHGYEDPTRPVNEQPMAAPQPVRIGDGAFIGIGAVVLMGVTVGDHSFVAANAVVTDDVEPFTLVVGNPARVARRWDSNAGAWVAVADTAR
jgi:carbonic anhydrase/acetyltransferase-like protein (isoleucine patch superfamily)